MKDTTIRYYRKKANISQNKLAELLNLPRTTISFFETKRQYPDINTAERIAEILQVPVGALWLDYELDLIREKSK
jgi:DNA-binding XRE family transcriptional regulator